MKAIISLTFVAAGNLRLIEKTELKDFCFV